MKKLRKALFYVLIALLVLIAAFTLSVYLFKDQIIREFIREANKSLNTQVKIGKTEVSAFRHFPNISLVFRDVYIEDSHKGQYPLLTASTVSLEFNPLQVWRGNYQVNGLTIVNSETHLKIDKNGLNNFTVLKEGNSADSTTIRFELKNVTLQQATVFFTDKQADQEFEFYTDKLSASIRTQHHEYTIAAVGPLITDKMRIGKTAILQGKEFELNTTLIYNDEVKSLIIQPSSVTTGTSTFEVKGTYAWQERNMLDIICEGKKSDIQTIASLLPQDVSTSIASYRSKGDVYFNLQLKGEISKTKSPAITASFGFTNATIYHPHYKTQIENASLTGSFASKSVNNLTQAALILKDITFNFNNEPFKANLVIQNLNDPEVIFNVDGKLDVSSLLSFYPVKNIPQASGTITANVAFEGKLAWLKDKVTAQQTSAQGSLQLDKLSLRYTKPDVSLTNVTGMLQFNNNDLALSDVTGSIGNSDFRLNGFFKNIITYILFDNQSIGIEADLTSNHLDVDELFTIGYGSNSSSRYSFSISPNVQLNFNCDVKSLRYKRFYAENLKGDLLVKNQMAVSRNINLKTMGGALSLSGIVDAKNPKAIDVMTNAKLGGIYVDSVFYVFKNFDQQFIEDKHLKGQATADVTFELTLNENLKLFQETLVADISAVIKNGELNNFEPIQQLDKYLDDEGLHALRFADLKNDIHIENKTVYIPQMEIRSNVTSLQISGTHTFDQHIDYRIITPLRSKGKVDVKEASTALEDQGGQLKLYLKITGTTNDYKVQYDTEAVRKKIASDLKKEVQELKDAFKTKGKQKKKELELSTEEFDWDNIP